MVLRSLFCVVCLAAAAAPRSLAQTIHGRLLEAESDRPIPQGQLTLLTDRGTAAAVAFTDADGRFRLVAPRPGGYVLLSRRLGYQSRSDPLQVGAQGVEIELRLAAVALTLDPVTIEAEVNARYLDLVGFYHRQRADFGHFITRDKIAERRPVRTTDVLNTVPGVRLIPDGASLARVRVQLRGAVTLDGGVCQPRVFVDGLIAIRGDSKPATMSVGAGGISDLDDVERIPELPVDDIVNPNDIEAIEIYRSGAQVPAEFGGMGPFTRCGAIVIWTRRGR